MQISSRTIRKPGTASESLFYNGEKPDKDVMLTLIHYDKSSYGRKTITDLSSLNTLTDIPGVKWLNVDGIHDVDIVETIGFQFGIDFLVLEDILDVNQRPKVDDHHNYVYTVLKMVYLDKTLDKIVSEQVSILFMKNIVITFQEQLGYDVFDPIRNRIMNNRGRIRREGADFLVYSLIDAIIDNYISVTDDIGDEIADIEKQVLTSPNEQTLADIYNLKLDIIFYRNAIWPVREVIIQLQKTENKLFKPMLVPYFRDVFDHTLQAIDTIKLYNDTITEILGIYSSSITSKTNKVMQRLTLITTIFMPMSVVAGIGGMSEWSMMTGPQNWKISYPLFILMLAVIGVITYSIIRSLYKRK